MPREARPLRDLIGVTEVDRGQHGDAATGIVPTEEPQKVLALVPAGRETRQGLELSLGDVIRDLGSAQQRVTPSRRVASRILARSSPIRVQRQDLRLDAMSGSSAGSAARPKRVFPVRHLPAHDVADVQDRRGR